MLPCRSTSFHWYTADSVRGVSDVLERDGHIVQLEVTPWLERLEGLAEDLARVPEISKRPAMDVIKLLVENPFVFGIVNLEMAVGWNAA